MKTYKKGISLIVLVITVIVLAILATTVIISLSNTNIITEANEAVVKTRFKSMQEQLTLYVADQYAVTDGKFKLEDLDAEAKSATIDEIFPELKDTKYYDYVSIIDGNIVMEDNMPDREIALEVISEYVIPEVITNYTQADIDASNGKLVAIGNDDNNGLSVIAEYSDDFTTLTITKNGSSSEGRIASQPLGNSNTTVTSVVIENGVTTIGNQVFGDFTALKTVTMANSVTELLGVVFWNCSALESVKLSNNIISLGSAIFGGCTSLKTINVPASVTSVSDNTFSDSGLTTINFEAATAPNGFVAPDGVTVNYNVSM